MKNAGYLLLVLAIVFWAMRDIGPGTALIAFGFAGTWTLVGAPVWCGAETRKGLSCRKNSYGLLLGCSYNQHRWQKISDLFKPKEIREAFRGWFTGAANRIATCALAISAMGTLITLSQFLMSFA
ncbi:hypothetical protein GALLR39Z86_48750 [Glycomyces algeriensis]|uniref:Uncharacterized protein n=2 Tax=Glycomyces algeriensis TaxID=256037 RepID=A0A9W6GDT6_9ACTN|nr:hypothetical protein GALLR39Z86_48750 [Glycomyces algeriensis]